MSQDNTKHNFKAFVWHATWLAFTSTFTEINTVLPGMILEVGGNHIHVGILTAIMVGVPAKNIAKKKITNKVFAPYGVTNEK